ncbi:sodium/hydrogen exchanger [Beutenbergia cavernae DSM 12333]|uniref:Sodium/hydrogen exchanger n=1 Tax=Beutenbergia cavernae (strain ATCC BAA-8 / DSM 12333 / CCUG 43141 / JCM 11478 / NBRC 16432 / NCIMB 13614 / HKI 0122) TaxID=471853 RepID=C5C4D9_BEUC1|nr:cation:proton antiporter [Beutenbergia cavernae]ACQ82063.1 sodium/hydrogen exchanger [Beutenbergia cavernae DSM 12333]
MGDVSGIALIVALGVAGQVGAKALRVPSILLLLTLGLLAGPVLGWLDPDAIFGEALFPLVSMAVGLLLFEESLKLDFARLRGGARRPVIGLVTAGALLTGIGATVVAHLVLGLAWSQAAVIGAILIVSGPTVVGPLLKIIRPKQPLESVLAFEGIFIDPIGAVLALAVANVALHAEATHLGLTALSGLGIGAAAALVLVLLIRTGLVPKETEVILALAFALGAYTVAEGLHDEAGLFATTALGAALANQRIARTEPLHEFGSHLGLLLVGALFIILAARVDLDALVRYLPATLGVVAVLVLVLRPLVAAVSTLRSTLTPRERMMVGWMAPRGIVAASTASVFALRFDDAGQPFPQLVPVVFGVVLLTAIVYGLTGAPVAQALGVRSSGAEDLDDDGVAVVPAPAGRV